MEEKKDNNKSSNKNVIVIVLILLCLVIIGVCAFLIKNSINKVADDNKQYEESKQEDDDYHLINEEALSDSELLDVATSKVTDYMSMTMNHYASSTDQIFILLGFCSENSCDIERDEIEGEVKPEGTVEYGDEYLKTNVTYDEFKEFLLAYISDNFFEQDGCSKMYINDNNMVTVLKEEKDPNNFSIIEGKLISKEDKVYNYEMKYSLNGEEKTLKVRMIKNNKRFLIDSIEQ